MKKSRMVKVKFEVGARERAYLEHRCRMEGRSLAQVIANIMAAHLAAVKARNEALSCVERAALYLNMSTQATKTLVALVDERLPQPLSV